MKEVKVLRKMNYNDGSDFLTLYRSNRRLHKGIGVSLYVLP